MLFACFLESLAIDSSKARLQNLCYHVLLRVDLPGEHFALEIFVGWLDDLVEDLFYFGFFLAARMVKICLLFGGGLVGFFCLGCCWEGFSGGCSG